MSTLSSILVGGGSVSSITGGVTGSLVSTQSINATKAAELAYGIGKNIQKRGLGAAFKGGKAVKNKASSKAENIRSSVASGYDIKSKKSKPNK